MPRTGSPWDRRIERARELAQTHPYSSEVLRFYTTVTAFQRDSYVQIQSVYAPRSERSGSLPAVLDEVDLGLLMRRWSPFLLTVAREAPAALAEFARDLNARGPAAADEILRSFWPGGSPRMVASGDGAGAQFPGAQAPGSHEPVRESRDGALLRFCAHAFLQPYAEYLAGRADLPEPQVRLPACPFCGSPPLAGVLRQEGEGAARSLLCSFCRTEWIYLRIACPSCAERNEKKMCVYSTAAFDCVRVEACDACRSYIKTVDLTRNGRAVPEVDELAAIPLTLWAEENGYSKAVTNVMGL